jgi:peroxiredoxin
MKNLIYITLLVALIAGCKKEPSTVCTITGKASNFDGKELYVTLDGPKDTIRINEDGTFSKELTVTRPIDGTLVGGRNFLYLYLEPGKTLEINFDGKAFDTSVGFGGDLGLPAEYLHEKTMAQQKSQERLYQLYRAPNTPADFKRVRDSIRDVETTFLEQFKSNNQGMPRDFVAREKKVLEYGYYADMYNYQTMTGYFNTDKPELPADWFSFMETIDLKDPALLEIGDISSFISLYVVTETKKKTGISDEQTWGNPDFLKAECGFVKDNFDQPEFYTVLVFDFLKQHIDSEGTSGIEDLVSEYLAKSTDPKKADIIREQSDKWAALAPGQPAPAFTLLDKNGKNVLLSDFKGKYVFIDFWATWCGPCKAEIPDFKILIDDYKNRNIVFISMSVDKDKAAWEKYMKEGYVFDGQQVFLDEKPNWVQLHDPIKANKQYLVMYIPTFTLIDPAGNIVSARSPRPSSPELRALLDAQAGL